MPVAQLDRAMASDAMCRAFESHRAYHVGTSYACSDFFMGKNLPQAPLFLLFAKRHAVATTFLRAGALRCKVFLQLGLFGLQWTSLHSDFSYSEKSVITLRHSSFIAERHSARLFVCKRTHNGSRSDTKKDNPYRLS